MGTSVSDFYIGSLKPNEIAGEILASLEHCCLLESGPYHKWLEQSGKNFQELSISDDSKWTLLPGKNSEYFLHIHPSRFSSNTLRVKSNLLKTAVAVIVFESICSSGDYSPITINYLRKEFLGLSPIKENQMEGVMKLARYLQNRCRFD